MNGRALTEFDKRRIAKVLGEGVCLHDVLAKIEVATQRFWKAKDIESRYEDIELIQRANGKLALRLKYKKHDRRAAPTKEAARGYITTLVTIYESATDKRIGRINQRYKLDSQMKAEQLIERELKGQRTHRFVEKKNAFLSICLRAAGERYHRRIIREVLYGTK